MPSLSECFNGVQEVVLSLLVSIYDCLPGILRKLCVLDDELVQVVAQKVGAGVSSVAIEDAEEAALWPMLDVLLGGRLHYVEHNTYAILVVVSDDTLVRVGRVAHDETILSDTAFGGLPTRQIQGARIGRWTIAEQELLYV